MSSAIRIIHYDEEAVGRRIKSSKKRFTWKFELENEPFTIELFASKFSGKKALRINGEKRFEGKKEGKVFHKSLEIKGHNIIIIEVSKQYDLMIDGVSFKILQKKKPYDPLEVSSGIMSNQLIPENQASWEKFARPYEIIPRADLNEATREKLPITKKTLNKPESRPEPADMRYIFGTESYSPEPRDLNIENYSSNKPRALSSAYPAVHVNHSNNLFF